MQGETRWVQTAIGIVGLAAVLSFAVVLGIALVWIAMTRTGYGRTDAKVVLGMVYAVLVIVALVLCRQRLVADPGAGRRLTVWVLVGMCLTAIVVNVVADTSVNVVTLAVNSLVPLTVIGLLTIPPDVRRVYVPLLPAGAQTPGGPAVTGG